jgi:hypothetical protein
METCTALVNVEQNIIAIPVVDVIDESSQPVKVRSLSFTLVDGYLRGEHRCRFELHATGCRDLKKCQRTMPSYELVVDKHPRHQDAIDNVIAQAINDLAGTAGRADIWVQPCCNLKRMEAIGRA